MNRQSRAASFREACLNIAIGFDVSLAAQMYFLPLIGVAISHGQNLEFALIMTAVSLARTYGVRRLFEWLHIRTPISAALIAIAAERRRQVEAEGYNAAHDDGHDRGELASAGAAYALSAAEGSHGAVPPQCFPWDLIFWNPKDVRRDLVRAGALILAELERVDRMRKSGRRPRPVVKTLSAQAVHCDVDPLGRFLSECTIATKGGRVVDLALYECFCIWSAANLVPHWNLGRFHLCMRERGYCSDRGCWLDIEVKAGAATAMPALAHGKTARMQGGSSV